MSIMFVEFQRPVTFLGTGFDYWSATETRHKDITCEDKGSHILFSFVHQQKPRRVRVPLTNIAYVMEEGAAEPKQKEKP